MVLVSFSAFSQTDFIVTSKADTLVGEVRILSYDLIERVQLERDKKKETYTALQVLSVNKDGKIYKPVKYQNRYVFMQLLKPGYLNLYGFKLEGQNTYDGRFLVKLNGTSQELPNIGFKKIMADFLGDCSAVANKIKEGDLVRTEIENIVDEYNTCMNSKSAPPATTPLSENDKTQALDDFTKKVEALDFESKGDAIELLKDIRNRVSKGEAIPNYLTEGLKGYVAKTPQLTADLETLLALLKK